jgi:dihydroflavonol-4-reductase
MGGVRMAKNLMWFDPSRAVRELGMPQNPLKSALLDAVHDLRIRFNLPESR